MFKIVRTMATFLLVALTFKAQAFIVGTLGETNVDYHRPTAIIVAGQGHALGTMFMQTAVGFAYRMKMIYPDQQLVIVSVTETDAADDSSFFRDHGIKIIESDNSTLGKQSFVDYLANFQRISSLQVFSHGSVAYGIQLENKYRRISENYSGFDKLIGHFTDDAYMIFYGCNTGWLMATALAPRLGVPVAGAFTSTDFKELSTDGTFYGNESSYLPAGVKFVGSSRYQNLRMVPDSQNYTGEWGNFDTGLGFYKFICPTGSLTPACEKSMAHWAMTLVTTKTTIASKQDFESSVKDFVCPNTKNPDVRKNCFSRIDQSMASGSRGYTPFNGKSLSCDWKHCEFAMSCKHFLWVNIGHCTAESAATAPSTAFMDQYRALMDGYDLLSRAN
jgi:hypothetical protein